jgi:hypothetical protein
MNFTTRIYLGANHIHFNQCREENFIGVGFNIDTDLGPHLEKSSEELDAVIINILQQKYPKKDSKWYSRAKSNILPVVKKLQIGDFIIAPDSDGNFHSAEITGPYFYCPDEILPHRRMVRWTNKFIHRSKLPEEIKKSIGSPNTCCDITRFSYEINHLLNNQDNSADIEFNEIISDQEENAYSSINNKLPFAKSTQLCLKNNNNMPMTSSEIWDQIKDYTTYITKTPESSLSTVLGFFTENSNRKHKSKTPIFRIVSQNPNKYVLIDPNNIQETEIDQNEKIDFDSDLTPDESDIFIMFWKEFIDLISVHTQRYSGRQRCTRNYLLTPTDKPKINYVCSIKKKRANIELYFQDKSPLYYKLFKLRTQIEKEFGNTLEWLDKKQNKCCVIYFVRRFEKNFSENKQEVMEFFLDSFPKFEKVFDRYLNDDISSPEEHYIPYELLQDTERVQHPFKQSICVLGEPGSGKSTTVRRLLKSAEHVFEIWEPTSTSGMLAEFSPDRSRYVPSRLGNMLIKAQKNPERLHTFVIDEAHKRETIRKIDDCLKGAISTRRWDGDRFIPQELQTEYLAEYLKEDETGNFEIPSNFSFMFISSKPDVIKGNSDIFERLDIVVLRHWKEENMNTVKDLLSRILSEEERKEI